MAAEVALEYSRIKVSSIESMLKTKSYLAYYQNQTANKPHNFLNRHDNIRGSDYYSGEEVQS
jgi:hypothetical protein